MATTDTTCKVTTCSFHHPQDKCAAGEILVIHGGNKAICQTFVARDSDTKPVGKVTQTTPIEVRIGINADDARAVNLGNVGHLYEGDAIDLQPLVSCDVQNCKYNRHKVCFADSMVINGLESFTSGDTNCDMYNPS
ncbi:DUF1540 domain-containing protein [Syntrophomonas erecta]